MEYSLLFPTSWDRVDPENDNIDVCLTFPDGRSYTFVVVTPENLKMLMALENKPYLSPGSPMLIAQQLTEEVVTQLIEELAQDEKLLNLYGSDIAETKEEMQ